MRDFATLPHDVRMRYRTAVEDAGCSIVSYVGTGMSVRLPNPPEPAREALKAAGLLLCGEYHFPLGSDHPPYRLRHAIEWKYGASRGFWLTGNAYPEE